MPRHTGKYDDTVPNGGSQQRPSSESKQPENRTLKSKSWKAPATIVLALFVGLGFALAQAWISRFGTAMAFAVKIALATSVAAAYTQHQWLRLQQESFRTEEVDALTSVLSNALIFMSSKVWVRHPMLAVVALVSWSVMQRSTV
jgi:protein-S-isoprenylcysteine O-methyltransferase Ste14